MATAIAAPGIPLDQVDPSKFSEPVQPFVGVALDEVDPAKFSEAPPSSPAAGIPLEEVDFSKLLTEEQYLEKLTPGQLNERIARKIFEGRPAHEIAPLHNAATKRYLESDSLFAKDLRTPEEKLADGETPEPLPNLPFGLEKVLPEKLVRLNDSATRVISGMMSGTFSLMNEAAKKVLRADLMATRFTSEEEKKAFAAAGQPAPALKIFPIPETEKPGAAISSAALGATNRAAALVLEGAEDLWHLVSGRDQAQAAQKLAGSGVDSPHVRKAQERVDAQVAFRLAAMRAEAGTPVVVNPQGQIEFGQDVPAPADRPDPETVASIQQSPFVDPTNFIPMGTGFAATRKPLLAGATLAAKEAPGALPTAMAKVTNAAAKGMHAAERAIDTSPIAQGLMAAATTAAVGGDAPQAALAALLGANVKNLGLAHRTIGRVGDSLDKTTGKLLGQIPPGPIGRFAASTYRTLAPEARTLALGQVYNMPFLLGADTEEEFTDMVMAGAFAHAVGSAAGRTLNGLNIAKNFFDAGDRAPEIRLPVKDVGVDPFLDAAHQELVSGLNNASNNFVESVRQAVGKGGGEAYVVSLDAYHKYLDDLVGKEVIGRDGSSSIWTAENARMAKEQQGMSFQTRAEDGSVRKIQLTPVRDAQPGLSVGHEATHFLERALLSDDERAYLHRETLRYYGEPDAHQYYIRHRNMQEIGLPAELRRDRSLDPTSWADMTPEQREMTLSEIIAEHGNAAFNALPIGKLGFDTGAQSYARTIYGMLGRMLERMGVKRPELSPEGFDPASKPTTGLGIEPSMRLSTLIENLIQAKMLDGELPASVGAKPAPGIDVAPRETQDAPKNVRPVEPKTTKPGFKKGDPIGDLRNENGRLIGRDATVKTDIGDGTYDVEYTDTATGRRVVGTVPGKWLESEVNPNAPRPEKQVFPTSPITSESPVGAAVAPTLPVPKAVENTTRPEGSAETSAETSANPNVRTTRERQEAVAGPADPKVIQENKELLKKMVSAPRSTIPTVETDYYSAKSSVRSPDQVVREKQRLAADAAERDGQPNPLRTRYQKIFVPYRVVENKNGTTTVLGMSLDKVIQNLDLLRGWLKTNPEAALVIDQAYLTSPQINSDLKKYLTNQANGYAGDGRKLTRPADTKPGSITPETPGYVPDMLPPDRAQVLNLLMGMEQPKTERTGQAFARRFAEANGITVGTIDGVSETNALRARLRERGFDPSILNAVVENLRVDRLTTPLKPRPDLTFPAGDTGIQRAGFMPAFQSEDHRKPYFAPKSDRHGRFTIFQNQYGNWAGYDGHRRVTEFGTDSRAARDWLFEKKAGPAAVVKKELQETFIRKGDDFWGIMVDADGNSWFGEPESSYSGVQCTGYACALRTALGDRVEIFGFLGEDNPASKIGQDAGGHDFAVVDKRFIVDPWLTDVDYRTDKGVYDLKDPADAADIAQLYGDKAKWKKGEWDEKTKTLRFPGSPAGADFMPRAPDDPSKEHVKIAAVRLRDGQVFSGRAHWEALEKAQRTLGRQDDSVFDGLEDGWLTNEGRFLDRASAMQLAKEAGQIDVEAYKQSNRNYEAEEGTGPLDDSRLESSAFDDSRQFMPQVEGASVSKDRDRPYRISSLTAQFDEKGSVTFAPPSKKFPNHVHVLSLVAEGSDTRGSEMLRRLKEAYPDKKIAVVGVAPDVTGFWEKARERGLIDYWTAEDTESFFGYDPDTSGYGYESAGHYMPQFKLGKTKVKLGDEYTPVLKGQKVVGRIEPDFANEGFRAMTVERDDLGTAPSPKEALKLFTVDNIKPTKKELAPVEKPKKNEAPAPTGWLLPDGEYAGQNDRTGVYQNLGDWHGEHILQNADDYASRFGLKRGRNEDLRLAALRSGFVRLRYDGASGRMGIEANAKHFKKQLPKLEDILEQNLGKIDRLDVNLFDDQGNVVRANGEAVFKLDDFAKSQAVLDILRGRPIREVDFMPQAPDTPEFKKWFGDSKVVDDEGQPLRLYHGTAAEFHAFNLGEGGGIFFSDDPFVAEWHAEDVVYHSEDKPRVVEAYLAIKNPKYLTADDVMPDPDHFDTVRLSRAIRKAKREGYDGIVIQDMVSGNGMMTANEYIAFKPTQVKSATDNRGTFDPTNPDIRYMPAFGIEKPVREEFQRIFERVKATDNDGATFNPDGTVADTSALPVIVTLGALTQDAATASALRAANFFNRHEEFLATPNARPGLFHFGDKLSADLNVALPLDRLDLAKKFAADNNQDSIYNAAAGEVVKTGGSGVPRLSSPLEYAVAAKLLSEGTYTTIDKVKQIAAGLEGTEVGSISNLDLRAKIKDAVAEAEAENDGKPLSKVRVNRIAREIETEARSRMVDVPVISLTPAKGKKTVLNPDTPEKWDEVNRRADDALRVTALDPELGLGEFGYRRAFAESGLSTDVPPAPEQFARYVREPALFAKMLRDAQEKNPQLIESALGGLAHVRKMHELARAGKLEPETVALHMAWGIASRMLAPFDQEGGWIRIVRSPEVLEAMASSINGTFSLSKDQWKATVQKAMAESNARTDDPAAYTVGRNAIANLNAFHLMLSQWNGHWQELTDIFNNPSLTGPQMRDAFFRQGFGGAGIKHKVVSFDILTLARDDVFIGDRWQVIHGNLPLLERIAKERGYDSPFNYDKNGTPQDRVGIYGAYGPLIDSPSVGQVYYKLIERGLAAIGASPEVSAVFGRPLSASDVHWLSWNIIKNEPVGHSSLEVTYDLLTSGTTLNRVGSKALANELATRPIRTQRFNPETKGFDEFTVENNRAVLRRAVNQ